MGMLLKKNLPTAREFVADYLNLSLETCREEDLEIYLYKLLKRSGALRLKRQTPIKTYTTTRRSDIESLFVRYEIKKILTYNSIKEAVGQLKLYDRYGSKILWIFPKKQVVIGLAPINTTQDPRAYESAQRIAQDYKNMGISVVFLNENSKFYRKETIEIWQSLFSFLLLVVFIMLIFRFI